MRINLGPDGKEAWWSVQPLQVGTPRVLAGDPIRDSIVLVQFEYQARRDHFLLSRDTDEWLPVPVGQLGFAKQVVRAQRALGGLPLGRALENARSQIEEEQRQRRLKGGLQVVEAHRGLRVREIGRTGRYWCREYGEIGGMPTGWSILPSDDPALEREVRKGPHWVVVAGGGTEAARTEIVAPAEEVERVYHRLGGETGARRRQERREKARTATEERANRRLGEAISRCFPRMPEEDVRKCLAVCRARPRAGQPRPVGRAQAVYFSSENDAHYLSRIAIPAVKAYARHNYTDYDARCFWSDPEESSEAARTATRDAVEVTLAEWR